MRVRHNDVEGCLVEVNSKHLGSDRFLVEKVAGSDSMRCLK